LWTLRDENGRFVSLASRMNPAAVAKLNYLLREMDERDGRLRVLPPG
jgi:hypothetical protein